MFSNRTARPDWENAAHRLIVQVENVSIVETTAYRTGGFMQMHPIRITLQFIVIDGLIENGPDA